MTTISQLVRKGRESKVKRAKTPALKGSPQKKGQKPFVIMITGNEGQRHKVFAESLGVDEYLKKPFRMDRLVELVTAFLAKS